MLFRSFKSTGWLNNSRNSLFSNYDNFGDSGIDISLNSLGDCFALDTVPEILVRHGDQSYICSSEDAISNPNQWNHIVYTYNTTNYTIYVNGVLSPITSGGVVTVNPATDDLKIGDGYFGNANGSIDEVMVWNRVLSIEEINATYNAGVNKLFRNFTNLADGQYNYTAYMIDEGGNTNQTEQRSVSVDTTAPQFTIGVNDSQVEFEIGRASCRERV